MEDMSQRHVCLPGNAKKAWLLAWTQKTMVLVKLRWRRGDMVKNGQKLKRGLFSLIENLILEMSPIGMIQQTHKKI